MFPDEYRQLFEMRREEDFADGLTNGDDSMGTEEGGRDAGDGGELIEVTARDLARRCLELVGVELGLTA